MLHLRFCVVSILSRRAIGMVPEDNQQSATDAGNQFPDVDPAQSDSAFVVDDRPVPGSTRVARAGQRDDAAPHDDREPER